METFDLKAYEVKIDKIINQSFSTSLMSNPKWRKLFSAISTHGVAEGQINLKRVNREKPYMTYLPELEDIEELWVSEGKNDCNYFYKEIEWVELLGNPKKINNVLDSIGQFFCSNTKSGVVIYGYKT